jgi:hypothetical protein
MLHWKIGEEMKTTVHIHNRQQLRCKTEMSKKGILLGYNKASQTYRWRKFYDSGNNEPNDTLMNVKYISGSITQPTKTANVPPVSRGSARVQKNYHDGERVASQRA